MRVVKHLVVVGTGFINHNVMAATTKPLAKYYAQLGEEPTPDEDGDIYSRALFTVDVEANPDGYCPLKVGQKVKVIITNEE